MRLPFFGLLSDRSPLDGLIEHYTKINECVDVIKESMECYVAGGACREFVELAKQVDEIENQADLIKRRIRNHLPRGLFMSVDKGLFLQYTKAQDNILDDAQEAMQWLAMRPVEIPAQFQKTVIAMIEEVDMACEHLGPALTATLGLINHEHLDRQGTKDKFWAIRRRRQSIFKMKNKLCSEIYNSDMDFKDIYQLIHYVEKLEGMGHNTENCADILRNMIAR
ncbi:DUF47 domain-containing protein [Desulfovibrio ferrophilus]|uniref:Phosphate transport regulator n=1 Tax=Desulfovibrio ferrophilus TaxID=241368 RepID=A0A2Z6B356_9BACT|nr:DUF47 family protein [Desulfovibrio ferrophilus]BBD09932.1 phosphate transport regulator [Desulfovibrio ferrophilus]